MVLRLTYKELGKRPVYTRSDILEREYPTEWEDAVDVIDSLIEKQSLAIDRLSKCKGLLSTNSVDYESRVLQCIGYKSLLSFAEKLNKMIRESLIKIADNAEGSEKEIETLKSLLSVAGNIIIPDNGVLGILQVIETAIDFPVYPHWSFRDITGTLRHSGSLGRDLIQSVENDILPTQPSIEGIWKDNKLCQEMIRIY